MLRCALPVSALRGVGGSEDEQERCAVRGLGLLVDGAGWWGWTRVGRRGDGGVECVRFLGKDTSNAG